jgi:hypothetical protein
MHRSIKAFHIAAVLTAATSLPALQACLSTDGGLWGASSPSDNLADATPLRDATAKDAAAPPRDPTANEAAAPAQPPPGGFDTDADGGRVTCVLVVINNESAGVCSRTFRCVSRINDPKFEVERQISCTSDAICKCKTEEGTETTFPESGYCSARGADASYSAALSKCMWP